MSIQLVLGEPDKTTKIGSQLNPTLAGQLTAFLQQNADVFAWTTNDLIGIDPSIVVHSFNVDPTYPPVKQKKRHFRPEKDKIIQDEVNQLVDSTFGHELLSLMDALQGYHQIMLNPDNQKRVSFITSGRNMEVYIDDMLVKSRHMDRHLADLAETFSTLRKYHIELNLAKCAFGVRSGKFLGYRVT
ncbi:UNVERIFIED_CONTAM: hypothetical protein Slati_4505600 [Sesamum latifolium]|uniref:Reverse transcriptase domain-containing protein n=1 Tax=Sesamum latifolium TaxID=2727402 RepID=A0AAW2SSF4_9LAMI